MTSPEPYQHFKAVDDGIPDGVYRVVGRDNESVTLLRVGDADGRRVHTGEVVTVSIETLDNLTPVGSVEILR